MTQTHLTDTRFDGFPLDPRLLQGVADLGFTHCTPIQAQTLPLALQGKDLAGQAQTGTGKTLAFALAILQRLLSHPPGDGRKRDQIRALVLAPTRELAVQVHRDIEGVAKHSGVRACVVYGGTGYQQQRDDLDAGTDILVGTPGRLIDYYRQGVFDLSAVEVVVVDEADRMFDLGFIKDIRFLLRRLPKPDRRQGMLFSATLSYRVTELAYEHMNNPVTVAVEPDRVTADRVRQICYMTANTEKVPLLVGLLKQLEARRTMVFVNTRRDAERVWAFLEGNGLPGALITGDVPQRQRLKLLRDFQDGALPVLVATDVAARGLHIPEVSHVVNFDLPEDPQDYVHRVGRTARAGAEGDAISFVCETYAFCLPDIEKFIGHRLPVGMIEDGMLVRLAPASRVRIEREERPRRDSRERPSRGGERRHSGSHSRSEPPPPPAAATPAAAPPQGESGGSGPPVDGGEPRKPRRRRRSRGPRPTDAGTPPPGDGGSTA